MIRVAVVAQAPALRSGIRALLESSPEVEVMAEAPTLEEMLPHLKSVDVLVLAAPLSLLEASRALLEAYLPLPPLLLLYDEPALDVPLLQSLSIAWGLLPLDASGEELIAAVGALQHGLHILAAPLAQALFSSSTLGVHFSGQNPASTEVEPLTEREMQVLHLLARGLANKQIAAALGISEHTVKFHVSAIYAKLGATNRAEAVRLGLQHGLVTL